MGTEQDCKHIKLVKQNKTDEAVVEYGMITPEYTDIKKQTFLEQAIDAIYKLKDPNGSSRQAIKAFLQLEHKKWRFLNKALAKGVKSGFFEMNKGKYKLALPPLPPLPPLSSKIKTQTSIDNLTSIFDEMGLDERQQSNVFDRVHEYIEYNRLKKENAGHSTCGMSQLTPPIARVDALEIEHMVKHLHDAVRRFLDEQS